MFCERPACRAKNYRESQAEKAQAETRGLADPHYHRAGTILSCACGRRYVLEVRGLDEGEAPKLTPTATVDETVTRTVLNALPPSPAETSTPSPPTSAAANSSELIAAAMPVGVLPALPAVVPAEVAPAIKPLPPPSLAGAEVRTIELYFTDQAGQRRLFWDAVSQRGYGKWRVRSYATPAVGLARTDGVGLGGMPGRWRDFYPNQSPTEFGLDPDLAVLYWDDNEQLAYAAEIELLADALGPDWRTELREICDKSGSRASR